MNQIIIQLKLKQITYGGGNIGRDLVFEFNSGPRMQRFRKTLSHGNSANFDEEIFTFFVDASQASTFNFEVTVTEFDKRASDQGRKSVQLLLDPIAGLQTEHRFSVEVAEAPKKNKIAVFDFEFELSEAQAEPVLQVPDRNPDQPLVAVISDLFIGATPGRDTFSSTDETAFISLLDALDGHPGEKVLVMAGNFLELWMTGDPLVTGLSPAEMLAGNQTKIQQIVAAHPTVFARLQTFTGKLIYLPGAHDQDMRLPLVQSFFNQLSGAAFVYQPQYYHAGLQLVVDPADGFDPSNTIAPDTQPLYRSLFQELGTGLSMLDDLGHPAPVHFDSFAPFENYKAYLNALRDTIADPSLISQSKADQLSAYILQQTPDPVLTSTGLTQISNFVQQLVNKDIFEDMGFLGEIHGATLRRPGQNAAAKVYQDSLQNNGPTKCLILGYTRTSSIQGLPRGLKLVTSGSWKRSFVHNPLSPREPIAQAYQQVTLISALPNGKQGSIRMYNLSDQLPSGGATYRFSN